MATGYLPIFEAAAKAAGAALRKHKIASQTGSWGAACFLKLQKPSWLQAETPESPFAKEVFFSIWVDEKSLRENRAVYGVQALRLRELSPYAIRSREFAAEFRKRFAKQSKRWPNVSIDHGPQTLMRGWIPLDADFPEQVNALVARFVALHRVIDELLKKRAVVVRPVSKPARAARVPARKKSKPAAPRIIPFRPCLYPLALSTQAAETPAEGRRTRMSSAGLP